MKTGRYLKLECPFLLGCILPLVLVATLTADNYSLITWYVRSGQWRADVREYLMDAEYVLCPKSGVGARMELDEDE